MPDKRRSNYTIRVERWCKNCRSTTPQVSWCCTYSKPDTMKNPKARIKTITWICQSCNQEEVETKEVVAPSDEVKIIQRFMSLSDEYDILGLKIESKSDELVFRVRTSPFDMSELRAIKYKQQETGFITAEELIKVRRAGYEHPLAVPPIPTPRDLKTLRKMERQRAFSGEPTPF